MNTSQIRLLADHANAETVHALQALLHQAITGAVTGIVFVAMRHGKAFDYGAAGTAYDDPVRALGAIQVLKTDIADRLR